MRTKLLTINIIVSMKDVELFNDHFQNYKTYGIPKAQLIIADIPYNIGKNAYGSNPSWYIDGDNSNGESELAGKEFFDTDKDFRITEFLHFCSKMLVKEPKEKGKSPLTKIRFRIIVWSETGFLPEEGARWRRTDRSCARWPRP